VVIAGPGLGQPSRSAMLTQRPYRGFRSERGQGLDDRGDLRAGEFVVTVPPLCCATLGRG
jgi:hypothetical protein